MRSRWQEWLIRIALVALAVTGVWTIWGQDIRALFHGDEARAAAPARPAATPPAGNAQGPF